MKKWTDEQYMAINERNADILVSAAAGSGKTAVLVERIISLITEGDNPLDIDRLLVVTFTKSAAGEMCQRIGDAIIEKLNKNPENEHLQKQITYLNRADIKTIDSFFLKVIKENYNLLKIDPSIRTADTPETELLKAEIIEKLFESLYENSDNDKFLELVEIYGGGTNDIGLRDLIMKMYNFLQSNPYPKRWADDILNDFNVNENMSIDSTKWGKLILKNIKFETEGILSYMKSAIDIINSENGPEGYRKSIEADYNTLLYFYENMGDSFSSVLKAYKCVELSKKIGAYRGDYKYIAEVVKNMRKIAINSFKNMAEKYLNLDEKFSMFIISKMSDIVKELIRVTLLFTEKYNNEKHERMILDFNDYGHMCIKILLDENSTIKNPIPSDIALNLQNQYDEILIDEYQDSNFIQELVLCAISKKSTGKNNMFLVGDVKQSIYRFRLAKPEIFIDKYESFDKSYNNNEKRIDLSKNFRSRENILNGINFIFKQIMTKELGDVCYDKKAWLYCGSKFLETDKNVGGSIELHIVEDKKNNDYEMQEIQSYTKAETEAYFISKRIKELMQSDYMIFDKKLNDYRKIEYRDITILLRSKKNWVDSFMEVFEKELIPAYAEATNGYFDVIEVRTIINFLKIIDNPIQDIPFIAILRCPIFRFTDEELVNIKILYGNDNKSFYDCVLNYLNSDNKDFIYEKLKNFIDILHKFRDMAQYLTVSELIKIIYNETLYFDYVGGTYSGKIKQANLLFLVEKAVDYENTSFKGLFNFILYIDKLCKNNIETGEASVTDENDNVVRVMSIHKSKGLEFPVVFLAGMGKKFNKTDIRDKLLLHQDIGIGGDYIDFITRARYLNVTKYVLAQEIDRENISEELRVLYVALTRAKEKLILIGTVSDMSKKCVSYLSNVLGSNEAISGYKMLKANSYIDWIIQALLRHREGQKILNMADADITFNESYLFNDESVWEIFLHNKYDIYSDFKSDVVKDSFFDLKNLDISNDYSGYKNRINDIMNWEYGNKISTKLPSNISITEIKRNTYLDDMYTNILSEVLPEDFEIPDFSKKENRKISKRARGTIIHTVMEKLDFYKQYTSIDIQNFINKICYDGIIDKDEALSVINYPFMRFFNSNIAERIRKSRKIFKEMPFALALTPFEIFSNDEYKKINEKIMVHGVIDCYFYERDFNDNEYIVLIDYKSDKADVFEIKKRYEIQLKLYKIAIERITGITVKYCIIYSFHNDCEIYV